MNLGIRWDSPGAIREKHDLDTVLLPNQPDPLGTVTNPVTGQGQQLVGQLVLVNSPLYPSRYERKQDAGLFSPRFGFAYKLTDTAVLRGGFGISFARTIGTDVGPRQSPINAATTTMVNSLDGGVTPDATLSNPFPNTTLLRPAGRSQAALFTLQEGQPITGMVPKQPWSYTEQWNMSFQQALGAGAVMELAYAGANGLHLSRNGGYNLNQLPDQYDSLGPALTRQVPNPLFGLLPTSAGALAARTVPAGQFCGLTRSFNPWRPRKRSVANPATMRSRPASSIDSAVALCSPLTPGRSSSTMWTRFPRASSTRSLV